jgi:uncharacterized protein YegP (UPF0339 family)
MKFRSGSRVTHQPIQVDNEEECAVAGRFVVVRDGDDGYRFRVEAEDGQLMATSEPYTSKSSAFKGWRQSSATPPTPRSTTSQAMTRPPLPRPA